MDKVMVIEDESALFDLLREILRYEGLEAVEPNHYDDLIEELRASKPVAVILDVHLKEFNGLDFLEQIRKDDELKDIYVMAISGMDHSREAKRRGADDFIMKPYMPTDMIDVLKQRIKR